jgi:hypothetical protein
MLVNTGMIANSKPMSGIVVNDDEDIKLEDVQREALLQSVETAFNEVSLPIKFDTDKIRPNIIAQYITDKAELIYDALRGVSAHVKMVTDAFAIMRISMEEHASDGQILDESIRTHPPLVAMMKDVTLHRIAREYENTSPGCDLTFYKSRLGQLESLLKRSKRREQVTPRRSVSHITVDRIPNAKGMITDVVVMAHAKPASDVTIAHYLPRDNGERLHSLKVEIEETQTVQHYVEQVINGEVTDRTRRTAMALLSANTIHREEAEELTVHLMGGVTIDDIICLAIMNATNLYLSGVRDLNEFDPEIIYHKVLDTSDKMASTVAQPEGRVITTGNPKVMLGYSTEQELVEAKDYSREGFASELAEANILGSLSNYAYKDLSFTRAFEITAMNGKLYKTTLDFYTLLSNKVPHNQALLRSSFAESYLAMHINIVKGLYGYVEDNFTDTGKITLDMHLSNHLFGYFEQVMRDTGTYNLVKSVGYDLVADVKDRSERATFFHELFEGDYYGQTAFAVIAFILLRTHRIDAETWKWVKERFEKTHFWTYNSESIIRSARGKA